MKSVSSIGDMIWDEDGGRAIVFSGHESFACRYGWLPKLYEAIELDPLTFSDIDRAILTLGLGRNMIKALRFWGGAFGLLGFEKGFATSTQFARNLLDPKLGHDPYLEDASSLWRLHWHITVHGGLGAWVIAFLEVQDIEISRERLIELVRRRAVTARGAITSGTATAHVDMLIRTYNSVHNESSKLVDEWIGCPLQELQLLEAQSVKGAITVRLPRGRKPELNLPAFAYALNDFWTGVAPRSRSISMRSLLLDRRSPGMVFKLDEASLFEKLEEVSAQVSSIELREDGSGGIELVTRSSMRSEELDKLAWSRC